MDQEKAIDDFAKHLIEQYPGKHDGRFRRAAVLGRIETMSKAMRVHIHFKFSPTCKPFYCPPNRRYSHSFCWMRIGNK
ncbi:hypothetical protein NSS79_27950 [Paenibacillus sp. FSL L8-0436]|uniref:hypothetical protein n=1 Tax=Paenibacillus sp. FSL L8-0436 TaxID=2954686 RepID=UPI00315815B5